MRSQHFEVHLLLAVQQGLNAQGKKGGEEQEGKETAAEERGWGRSWPSLVTLRTQAKDPPYHLVPLGRLRNLSLARSHAVVPGPDPGQEGAAQHQARGDGQGQPKARGTTLEPREEHSRKMGTSSGLGSLGAPG